MKIRQNILRVMALTVVAASTLFATASQVQAQNPSVRINSPVEGIPVTTSDVTVLLEAKANEGTLSHVNVRLDGGPISQAVATGNEADGWVEFSVQYDGLADKPNYEFKAFPVDSVGQNGYAKVIFEVKKADPVDDTEPPTKPTGLTLVSKTSSSITVAWNASSDNVGVDRYKLRYPVGDGHADADFYTPETEYTITNLTANTAYRLKVKALDAAGNQSVYTAYLDVTTDDAGGGDGTFLEWANLPEWANPATVGSLVAYNQVDRDFEITWNEVYLHYSDVNTGHAALRFARTTEDATLASQIIARYKPLDKDSSRLIERNDHGKFLTSLILFEEYKATGNNWYYNKAMDRAEGSWQTRNNWDEQDLLDNRRFWSDDFYLSDLVNSDYYRIEPDPLAIDRMCKWLVVHLRELQVQGGDNKGLMVHHRETNTPWGRGCGWAALGLTEGLRAIPASDPDYNEIMQGYLDLMDAIVRFQCADDLWGQVIDRTEAWTETSASALFVYALVVGIDNGWLDINKYGPVAKSGWLELVRKVDADGNLADVCIGTTKRYTDAQYLSKRTQLGDMHGQAPMIWAAEAMLRDEY